MSARQKLTSLSARSVNSWRTFAAGAGAFVAVAGALDFFSRAPTHASLGARTVASLYFGLQLFAAAGAGAALIWLGMRVVRGRNEAEDFRDSLLWSACLIGGLIMLVRMLR